MTTKQLSRDELLQQAHEAEVEERALLDQLNNIPSRVAEAKRAAESRFRVMNMKRLSGESTDEPVLDFSEAQSILDSEEEIKREAKAAGITKLRAYAALHRHDAEQHRATFDSLGEPLESLELQAKRVNNDLRAVRNARMTANKKHEQAWVTAQEYERAAAYAENASDPIRRM